MWSSGKTALPWLRHLAQQPVVRKSTMSSRKPVRIYYPEPREDPTRDVYLGGPEPAGTDALREAAIGRRVMNRPGQRHAPLQKTESASFRVREPDSYQGTDSSHAMFLREQGLPKIIPIHAWDKKNKNLRSLRHSFLKKTAKVVNQTETELEHDCQTAAVDSTGTDLIVLESKRLIQEAMERDIDPQTFITSRVSLLKDFPLEKVKNKKDIQLYWLPYETVSGWSDLTTSPGFAATFKKDDFARYADRPGRDHLPMTVILDNIRHPDNFGGVLRLAAAVGCMQVIATSGCVDAWQSKVIRAGAGAHFNLPVRTGVKWNEIYHHLPANASAATQVIVCDSPDSAAAPSAADGLAQLAAQADSFKCTDPGSKLVYDYSFDEPDLVEKFARIPLPEVALSRLGIQRRHTVVVIGGETHGVSKQAHKFALEQGGVRAFVPLFNNMESLNALSAASIILYHCQTQNAPPSIS